MVPFLLKLEGRKENFVGSGLGNPNPAEFLEVYPIGKRATHNRIVTVEIAALYLISAIYYGNLEFAQNPFLTDLTLAAERRTINNDTVFVKRAWLSTANWYIKSESVGLERLRATKVGPLTDARIAFW